MGVLNTDLAKQLRARETLDQALDAKVIGAARAASRRTEVSRVRGYMYDAYMLGAAERRSANLIAALAVAVSDGLRGQLDSESAALITLYERGGLTIEFLRRVIGLSHSATVRLVDRLSDDGSVERGRGLDARSISVRLTARGRRRAARLRRGREQVLIGALAGLDERERLRLGELAEKVLSTMTDSRWQARFTCRLCDQGVCQTGPGCPVDRAVAALGQ
jgi:DNA-binding MarR family transcriptional regulator